METPNGQTAYHAGQWTKEETRQSRCPHSMRTQWTEGSTRAQDTAKEEYREAQWVKGGQWYRPRTTNNL